MTLDELLTQLAPEAESGRWIFVHPLDAPGDGFAGESPTRRRRARVHMEPRQELAGLDKEGREVYELCFRAEFPRDPDGWRRMILWGAGSEPERALTILREWMGPE